MLIPEFPSQTHAFFWREIQAWRAEGLSVEILSTRRPPADACRHEWADDARNQTRYLFPPGLAAGMRALGRPAGVARALGYVAGLRQSPLRQRLKLAVATAGAADLAGHCGRAKIAHIHCHSFADAAHLCALARRMGGPPFSLTLHGDLPVYGLDHASKLQLCSAVTTAGPHLVEPVASLGFPRERILSNPMGVDTNVFKPPALREGRPGAARLITVARLNRNKGHRFALEAIGRLVREGMDLSYTIVGDGPYRAELEREIAQHGLEARTTLAGTRGEGEVLTLLTGHDIFLLPSVGLGEAAPVSVMEAMACGLPVIASTIGSTPAMIRHGETGFLVPQEDAGAIEGAIRQLAMDLCLRARVGQAARVSALEQFDARLSSLRLLEHIRRWSPACP